MLDKDTEELDKVTEDVEEADTLIDYLSQELAAGRQEIKDSRKLIKPLQRKSDRHSQD